MATQTVLELERMTPQLGAIVRGLDLRESLDDGTTRDLKQAVLDHGVLYFRDQDLTREQYLEFMSRFGTPSSTVRGRGSTDPSRVHYHGHGH